jgi:hypothetical protein
MGGLIVRTLFQHSLQTQPRVGCGSGWLQAAQRGASKTASSASAASRSMTYDARRRR